MATQFTFQNFTCVALGALCGVLIALPAVASSAIGVPGQMLSCATGAAFGAAVGWRRKDNRFFYYYSIAAALILALLNANAIRG